MFVMLDEVFAAADDARCVLCRGECGLEVDGEAWSVVAGHSLECPSLSPEARARSAQDEELMASALHCAECGAVEHPPGVLLPAGSAEAPPADAPSVDLGASLLVVDERDAPLGFVQPSTVIEDGSRLAFELAAVAGDHDAVVRVASRAMQRVGSAGFGYVAAAALSFMADTLLGGAFDVAKAMGVDMRPDMAAFAEGRTPHAR